MTPTPTPGQIAYEAYCAACNNHSLVSGAELPRWERTTPAIRLAWESAARAVLGSSRHDSLDQALNEGDGGYRP
jgi:hypothetical protein